ncbi:MAG: aminopeptidase [Lachnospiraceae bacterium]|nr:aminopeptidase [Lachnospiraceae bacterium]
MKADSTIYDERYRLVMEGIHENRGEEAFGEPLLSFFKVCSDLLSDLSRILDRALAGGIGKVPLEDLARENHRLYEDILPENYDRSFANPDYIVPLFERAGLPDAKETAGYLSFLYTQIRGLIPYTYEGNTAIFTLHAELYMEIMTMFRLDLNDGAFPGAEAVRHVIYSFESDNCDIIIPENVAEKIDPGRSFLRDIVCGKDLSDERYLYLSGEYVSENERAVSRYLASLTEEDIQGMADTFTEGYRKGFEVAGKPLDKKTSANIRYSLGFERVIRAAVANFEKLHLSSVIYRAGTLALTGGMRRIGFCGASPNRQYGYDHKDDAAIFLDGDLVTRRLEVLEASYRDMKVLANGHAGPAVMETFGEKPFTPRVSKNAVSHTDKTRKLALDYANRASLIVNRYIISEERSFTIIAYPIPEIGKDFEKIFADTVKLNNLPSDRYQKIQQKIIDALDKADHIEVKGRGANTTDLRISLHTLRDPEKETNFENCVADVNIPVGEVFTSPVLKGTSGVLNVTRVFLNGLLYKDLKITFTDGMITDYTCSNYEKEEDNRAFIKDNILFKHDTLPIGEFAIGTNTTAYRMGRDYDIEGLLPILIGEKTGPHFAVGDTCYSHEEDIRTYNPDGKEIIARENEVSARRHKEPEKAYFQCHTDVTIPYEEIGYIRACGPDRQIPIIEDAFFVLPGTEELNEPLKASDKQEVRDGKDRV